MSFADIYIRIGGQIELRPPVSIDSQAWRDGGYYMTTATPCPGSVALAREVGPGDDGLIGPIQIHHQYWRRMEPVHGVQVWAELAAAP